MGQTARTTKLLLDLSGRDQGGANRSKRNHLEETATILNVARQFYLDFFLAHPDKVLEQVKVVSKQTGEVKEGVISADKLLTWAEFQTVETAEHPTPLACWNFSERFPDLPSRYRRSVIKDVIGKARAHLTQLATWQAIGKKRASQDDRPPVIIPHSMQAPIPSNWMPLICVKALSDSKSTLGSSGCG